MYYGIRYVLIGLGTPDDPADQFDVDTLVEVLHKRVAPLVVTAPSEKMCDRITGLMMLDAMTGGSSLGW